MIKKLEDMLGDDKPTRKSRMPADEHLIWDNYRFDTGAGNRDEIFITNISIQEIPEFSKNGVNWTFFEANDVSFLVGADNSTLFAYPLDGGNVLSDAPISLSVEGVILIFKMFSFPRTPIEDNDDVIAILCVESYAGISLLWYRFIENTFHSFWSWPVQKRVKDLEFIHYEDQNKLFLLDDNEIHSEKVYSPIDIYCLSIDFASEEFNFWLCDRTLIRETYEMQVCSNYESVILGFQGRDDIILYEYTEIPTEQGRFQYQQTIKSHDLKNFICFESGYLQYLVISGPQAGLYSLFEDEYEYNEESAENFDLADIVWIKNIPIKTYREDSLLLLQLKNSTVIALSWHGIGFQRVALPNQILDRFDLSRIVAVPKFGFLIGNEFVKIDTELRDVESPVHEETKSMLKIQMLLKEVLKKQDSIITKTEEYLERSYLRNPVITGIWNLTTVNATNVTLKDDVYYGTVTVGSTNLTKEDIETNLDLEIQKMDEIEKKLDEMQSTLDEAVDISSGEVNVESDIEINGNFTVAGTLYVKNLTVDYINGVPISKLLADNANTDEDQIIRGKKCFPYIEADHLSISTLNGIPVDDILFSTSQRDYSDVDLSKIRRLEVEGHLNVSTLNGVDFNKFMENVVWKDQPAVIPGHTIIEGGIVANELDVNYINKIKYPEGYVLVNEDEPVYVSGVKTFDTLSVTNLLGIDTINDIDFDDFVQINKVNVLTKDITIEELIVDERFELEGNITGLNVKPNLLLGESNVVTSNVDIMNLRVLGNIIVEEKIGDKTWSDFDDILLKTEKSAEITGNKTFLGHVAINSNLTITSGMINGRSIEEFVTLDTEQDFPYLEKISANVTIKNADVDQIKELEALLQNSTDINGTTNCLEKFIIFNSPILVDELLFDTINGIPRDEFERKLNKSLQIVYFKNLTTTTLVADEIIAESINGGSMTTVQQRSMSGLNFTGKYTIDKLQVDDLRVDFINNMTGEEFHDLKEHVKSMYHWLVTEDLSLDSLQVTGYINATSINGRTFEDLYTEYEMGPVILENGARIENLEVLGFINGLNFTEYIADAVFKTDTDIVISGYKSFENVTTDYLDVKYLNGHPPENILDPRKKQVLTGPVTINGTVNVLRNFSTTGKINDVPFEDLINKVRSLGNNEYEILDEVEFTNNVSIVNLFVNGSIQGMSFDNFLDNVVFKDEDNVTITGPKVFKNSVVFKDALILANTLNDLNLTKFYETVVLANKPIHISSPVKFTQGINVEKDLIVKKNLDVKSIMGIDMDELQASVLYVNRPMYIPSHMTFTNVTFLSDIRVEKINDIDMNELIPLHTQQMLPVDILRCTNLTVDNLEILGKVNGYDLKSIYEDTFMLTGNQNITGHIKFRGKFFARQNFDAQLINGYDPKQIVLRSTNDTITGNFVFKNPLQLDGSLRIGGLLNDIDPLRWQGVAVMKSFPMKQIINGNWTVHGNVYFKKGAKGSEFLNGINVTELSNILATDRMEMDSIITEARMNLESMCEDIENLASIARNQVYIFKTFDYLQILQFDDKIISVHYFELDEFEYLLISYDTCRMNAFVFDGAEFELAGTIDDFGIVQRWITFRSNDTLYFVTLGKPACGRNSGNLWRFENDEFIHTADLENLKDIKKLSDKAIRRSINDYLEGQLVEETNTDLQEFSVNDLDDSYLKSVLKKQFLIQLSANEDFVQKNNTNLANSVRKRELLKFKAGVSQKEHFLYYDKDLSRNYVFICSGNITDRKIVQTIKVHKPHSFLVLNFDGFFETLLVFMENRRRLRVYEYKGVQGFLSRDNIQIDADKLFSFKLRKYKNLAKKYQLALIHGSNLTILEAQMYGEKLDMEPLTCLARL
ncbi:hypothetical protein KM043_018433 [Ampulex compressa]|nr:hypothetical protein KM043_018433 [Ampulex compressa]